MATSSKVRMRRMSSTKTKYLLRKALKVVVAVLVLVWCCKWLQRRKLELTVDQRETSASEEDYQVKGIRVLEERPIDDDGDASVYDQLPDAQDDILHQLELSRKASGVKTSEVAKGTRSLASNTVDQTNGATSSKVKQSESEGSEPSQVKNILNETETAKKASNATDEVMSNLKANINTDTEELKSLKEEAIIASFPHVSTESSKEMNNSESDRPRKIATAPRNESANTIAIESTINRLKDVIGNVKSKLEEMQPPSGLRRRYVYHPKSNTMQSGPAISLVDDRRENIIGGQDPSEARNHMEDSAIWTQEHENRNSADPHQNFSSTSSPWGWECMNERCVKRERSEMQVFSDLNTCRLTCGPSGPLWPIPTGVARIGKETVKFLHENLILKGVKTHSEEVRNLVEEAFKIFRINVLQEQSRSTATNPLPSEVLQRQVQVDITVSGSPTRLSLETSEAYTLDIINRQPNIYVSIYALTFFGARHGLETLSQLMVYDDNDDLMQMVSSLAVSDAPAFKYRGILLDTSRNFFSVESIKRTLDAMAANKLNTFHWHITDTHSFPMVLETLPKMAYYGAYSSRQVYLPTDIRHLVEYGRVRGIRVMPEFDVPAHVGNGWHWAEKQGLGKVGVCMEEELKPLRCKQSPCGQLNVINKNTYNILNQIYKEMVQLFGPLDFFHFGGDEVNLDCWNSTEEIVQYMREQGQGLDSSAYYQLWGDFETAVYGLLTKANEGKEIPGLLWTSELTEKGRAAKYIDRRHYTIQIRTNKTDSVIKELLEGGFRVVFSNHDHWCLECGLGGRPSDGDTQRSPSKGWQLVYDNSPYDIAKDLTGAYHEDLILGGEAILWSDKVDEMTLDSKLWPRSSALAERLWSNPRHSWASAVERLSHHRQRMVSRGIAADRIQSEWCHQNEGC